MKQMIARLDDELHASLKAKAATEGRSLNDLVVEALAAVVARPVTRASIRERARQAGMLVLPDTPMTGPPDDAARAGIVGTGRAVSEALRADRRAG